MRKIETIKNEIAKAEARIAKNTETRGRWVQHRKMAHPSQRVQNLTGRPPRAPVFPDRVVAPPGGKQAHGAPNLSKRGPVPKDHPGNGGTGRP
jgi:hypothetical protein